MVASGDGTYAFAGPQALVQVAPAPPGPRGVPVRLLSLNGGGSRLIGRAAVPSGEFVGSQVEASPFGVLVELTGDDDLVFSTSLSAGRLGGPLRSLPTSTSSTFSLGFHLDSDRVVSLRYDVRTSEQALVSLPLGSGPAREVAFAGPSGEVPLTLHVHGGTAAVLFGSLTPPCRAEAHVLRGDGTTRWVVPVGARLHHVLLAPICTPSWSEWDVQADGKLIAFGPERAGRSTVAWFDTAGGEHRLSDLADPFAGVWIARDRLLYVSPYGRGRAELVSAGLAGQRTVLDRFDDGARAGATADFDGVRALWVTRHCAGPLHVLMAEDVNDASAPSTPRAAVCGASLDEVGSRVSATGRGAFPVFCEGSSSLRCRGRMTIVRDGHRIARSSFSIAGGEDGRVSYRVTAREVPLVRRVRAPTGVRVTLSWRTTSGSTRARTQRATLTR